MRELLSKIKRRRVWGIGAFVLFTLLFLSWFAWKGHNKIQAAPGDPGEYAIQDDEGNVAGDGGNLIMRRSEEIYRVIGIPGNVNPNDIKWSSQSPDIINIKGGTKNPTTGYVEGTGNQVTLEVKAMVGNSAVNVDFTYTDSDGNLQSRHMRVTIEVAFSVQEFVNAGPDDGIGMIKPYPNSLRKALYMNYNKSISVGQATDFDCLRLVFGDGTSEKAEWRSEDENVLRVYRPDPDIPGADHSKIRIQAVGVGATKLHVYYNDETATYEDVIEVYVLPKLTISDVYKKDTSGQIIRPYEKEEVVVGGQIPPANPLEVDNHITIGISTLRNTGIGGDVDWVIGKTNEQTNKLELVRDSLNNTGVDGDDAALQYIMDKKQYRLNAKAGRYTIEFYPKGTYKNFDDAHAEDLEGNQNRGNIKPVSFDIDVRCDKFEDRTVVCGLGGSCSLSDLFNIPFKTLIDEEKFKIRPVNLSGDVDGDGVDDSYDSDSYISYNKGIISAIKVGEGKIRIEPKDDTYLPGLRELIGPDGYITITVKISETFSLNLSRAEVSVGQDLSLSGIIGSNTAAQDSQFEWSVSEDGYLEMKENRGQSATFTAVRETPANMRPPLKVSLAWTDTEGITWVSDCIVIINQSVDNFTITPDNVRLEVGESEYLQTSLSGSNDDILWVSSDTSIVTVEPQTGNIAAKITAMEKTGDVVITAINKKNNTYATALVTVTAPITDIKIDKGPAFTTSIGTPFVFLEAIYQPANATSTEMIWESSDESVATVDANGMVTVLKLGQTTITVKPVYNPNGVFAQCILTVKDDPITAIQTDVSTLNMKVGDTYDVKVTLTPENPTDRTLTWTTSKASVATVTNGRITAVGVGTATIMVQGGNASPVMIEVNVRQRLDSFAFESTSMELEVNQTKKLNIIFTPAEGANTNVTFYSSDDSIVTVDNEGNITGISVGTAMITCISEDLGEYRPITCMVTVIQQHLVATDFTIDPLEQTIQVGEDFTILPIFTPAETTNKEVRYQSLDETIATVTEEGVVTGVMAGQTVIQCTAVETNLTALCKVTVENAITFSLNPSSREIAIGKSFTIRKVTNPSNVDKAATWRTSNSKIASISASGRVTGKKIGSCTITCTLKKYKQSATCRVKVARLRSTLKLDKSSIRMNVGSTYRLKKTVWSNNSSNPSVKFTSRNKRVASVGSSSGKITAKRVGSTVITAKTTDAVHATARCRVTVIRRATSISLNKTYAICHIGNTIKLKANIKPQNVSIKKVKWSTSDDKIASVTGSGKITGYAEGEVYITATTTDGSNRSARCLVKVMEPIPATNILVAQQKLTMKRGNTAQLSYTVLPDNQTDTIKMASDNKSVATVTNAGKVKAVGTGVATITITSSSGTTATVEVNVVELNKSSVRMRQFDTETLRVIGTSDPITWYSANNRVATVANGLVVGKGLGTTYIYAYVNGCKMACRVEIVSVNSR